MSNQVDIIKKIEVLESSKNFRGALECAQIGFKKNLQSRELALKLGQLLIICKEYAQGLNLFNAIIEQNKRTGKNNELSALIGLATCLFNTEKYQQSEQVYEQLHRQYSNNPDILVGLAACKRHDGKLDQAKQFAELALKNQNNHKGAHFELAEVAVANNDFEEAIKHLENNIWREDVHGDSIDRWMEVLQKLDRNRYCQDSLEKLSKQYPEVIEFIYGFAVLANRAGEITLARPAYKRALELSPSNPRIYYEMGVLERVAGNLELSQELIGKALELNPDNPAALRTYGSDIRFSYGDENYKRLNYVAAKFSKFTSIEQIHLHYALAKAQEDVGELDSAFRHYSVAGEKKRKMEKYNEKDASKLIQIVPQVVTNKNLVLANERGFKSDIPVFVLGMPRSGTSLIEQILSAHPDIFGAGELKFLTGILENIGIGENKGIRLRMGDKEPVFDYDLNVPWEMRGQKYVEKLQKLTNNSNYKRIVDKMPGNFNFVGLIHAILPNAKIIHSRRHPVETCLSIYRIHFAEGHQWSYNLGELGRFYKRYWQLMKHWRESFPGLMYEAVYEENVADVERSAKKLIDFLGLEWNENCLNFYNVDRPVKTASVTQVRKPIYKTSTNRWRKYEKYLGPLLEELGDIVPEYEAEIAHLIEK